MSRTALLAGLLAIFGCYPRGSAPPDTDPVVIPPEDNPSYASLTRSCDPEAGTWLVDAESVNPSDGIVSWWTVDGVVVERQRIEVVESDPGGAWDRIRAELNIVNDWREVTPGSSTQFRCNQGATTVFWLLNPVGARVACETRGPNPEVFDDIDDVPACP
jgi:hypothetical protein